MNARGFRDEDYDEQDCDIDSAPIRIYFDEPDRAPRRAAETFSLTGRLRRMLVGDEIFVSAGDWYSEQGVKRIATLKGKTFTWIKAERGFYVYRDA